MLCSGSLYAAVLLACWGFILYGVYARFGQEKSGRAALKSLCKCL